MTKRAKEMYLGELSYADCYHAMQTMNRCIAENLENGDSIFIRNWWDIKPKLFKSIKRHSKLLNMDFEVPERFYPRISAHTNFKRACTKFGERLAAGEFDTEDEDEDFINNYYKNLIWVDWNDFKKLKVGEVTWQELGYKQEYIEYENKVSYEVLKIYDSLRGRCNNSELKISRVANCYEDVYMSQEWIDNSMSFVKWYLDHYYEVSGESMAVDKDLFGNGSKEYGSDTCCILPQGSNTLLSNCKKHYRENQTTDTVLPMGIRYNSRDKKYYGEITLSGTGSTVKLTEWDSIEDAFAEYKTVKKADVIVAVTRYKEVIPEYIYKKFFDIEINPY